MMTANLSHFLLKHSPKVTFKGTENSKLGQFALEGAKVEFVPVDTTWQ